MKHLIVNFEVNSSSINTCIIENEFDSSIVLYEQSQNLDAQLNNLNLAINKAKKMIKYFAEKKDYAVKYSLLIDETYLSEISLVSCKAEILVKSNLTSELEKAEINKLIKKHSAKNSALVLNNQTIYYQTENNIGELKTYSKFPLNKVANKLKVKYVNLQVEKNSFLANVYQTFLNNKIKFTNVLLKSQAAWIASEQKNFKKAIFVNFVNQKLIINETVNGIILKAKDFSISSEVDKIIKFIKTKYQLNIQDSYNLVQGLIKNYQFYKTIDYSVLTNIQKDVLKLINKLIGEKIINILANNNFAEKGYEIVVLENDACIVSTIMKNVLNSKINRLVLQDDLDLTHCMQGVVKLLTNNWEQVDQTQTINSLAILKHKTAFNKTINKLAYVKAT